MRGFLSYSIFIGMLSTRHLKSLVLANKESAFRGSWGNPVLPQAKMVDPVPTGNRRMWATSEVSGFCKGANGLGFRVFWGFRDLGNIPTRNIEQNMRYKRAATKTYAPALHRFGEQRPCLVVRELPLPRTCSQAETNSQKPLNLMPVASKNS